MPEVVVGHPCVLKVDSRLRGNDGRGTKNYWRELQFFSLQLHALQLLKYGSNK